MTLEEMKQKVYALIEEYSEDADELTEDEDLATKMNTVINQVQNELSRIKKIEAYRKIEGKEGDIINFNKIDNRLYQLNIVKGVECETIGNRIKFNEDGEAEIYYFRYPKQIDMDTDDDFTFDLSTDVLEIMPYGVAADLLKSDVSSSYGRIYADRYQELKQQLDPRYALGSVYFEGGFDI